MRVGFVSAPITATSGYGRAAKEVCCHLADMGYVVVNVGGRGPSVTIGEKLYVHTPQGNRILVLPTWGQTGDRATLEHYIRHYKLDAIVSLYDAYVLTFGKPSKPWAAQFPIDTEMTRVWVRHVLNADYVVAMSRFGEKELLKHFPDFMVKLIPHGVDTTLFKPVGIKERLDLRRQWGIPENSFVMLNVSANWGERKALPQLMKTFKRFLKIHKEAVLYLYTNLRERTPIGYDLMTFAEELGIGTHVMGPKFNPMLDSIEDEKLAELYAIADVYVSASFGEGFGLPILESLATGTPVIAPSNSSQVELVSGGKYEGHQDVSGEVRCGWLAGNVPRDMWEDVPVWIPLLASYPVPDLRALLECMVNAYENPRKLRAKRGEARKSALEYDWERVIPKWDALLREMAEL